MNILSFNVETQHLSKLCKHGHDWQDTGKSLRWKCDNTCVICKRLKVQQKTLVQQFSTSLRYL